jgi:hypothetical protein
VITHNAQIFVEEPFGAPDRCHVAETTNPIAKINPQTQSLSYTTRYPPSLAFLPPWLPCGWVRNTSVSSVSTQCDNPTLGSQLLMPCTDTTREDESLREGVSGDNKH